MQFKPSFCIRRVNRHIIILTSCHISFHLFSISVLSLSWTVWGCRPTGHGHGARWLSEPTAFTGGQQQNTVALPRTAGPVRAPPLLSPSWYQRPDCRGESGFSYALPDLAGDWPSTLAQVHSLFRSSAEAAGYVFPLLLSSFFLLLFVFLQLTEWAPHFLAFALK